MHRTLGIIIGIVLFCLHLALGAFFVLWQIADTAAINRSESGGGFSESQLLPNGDLLWLAAHASLALLVALDALLIAFAVSRSRKARTAAMS